MKKKTKVAIVSLTACEGCQIALLDLGEKFFDFLKKVDLVDFGLIEEAPFPEGKIDIAFIEGNPITNTEFLKYATELIQRKIPKIPPKPVCSECPFWGKESCFLRKREPCLGPIILAGCGAVCTKNNFPCYGCRGPLGGIKPQNFLKTLEKMRTKEEIEDDLEIFGLKDMIAR